MKDDLTRVGDYDPNKLIEDNMGLVVQLAKSFTNNPEVLDEYIQLGRIGLWRAIKKHDPKKGKLSTIAWNYIRWEIIKHFNKNKKFMHKPLYDEYLCYNESVKPWEYIPDLTKLEHEVLQLKYEGCTFREIGYEFGKTKNWAYKIFNGIRKKIRDV